MVEQEISNVWIEQRYREFIKEVRRVEGLEVLGCAFDSRQGEYVKFDSSGIYPFKGEEARVFDKVKILNVGDVTKACYGASLPTVAAPIVTGLFVFTSQGSSKGIGRLAREVLPFPEGSDRIEFVYLYPVPESKERVGWLAGGLWWNEHLDYITPSLPHNRELLEFFVNSAVNFWRVIKEANLTIEIPVNLEGISGILKGNVVLSIVVFAGERSLVAATTLTKGGFSENLCYTNPFGRTVVLLNRIYSRI